MKAYERETYLIIIKRELSSWYLKEGDNIRRLYANMKIRNITHRAWGFRYMY